VWAVQYYNGCGQASSGIEIEAATPICGITTTVLIDAQTGDFISAFEESP